MVEETTNLCNTTEKHIKCKLQSITLDVANIWFYNANIEFHNVKYPLNDISFYETDCFYNANQENR